MKLNYLVAKIIQENKSVEIKDENFVTIKHRENGISMYTAFIGNGESNKNKISIKISPSGGVLEINRMAGGAVLNAEILLKKDSFNKVLANEHFISLYKIERSRLVVDL